MFAMADHRESEQMEVHRRISGETEPNELVFGEADFYDKKRRQVGPAEEANMLVGVAPNLKDQTIHPEVDPQEKGSQRW